MKIGIFFESSPNAGGAFHTNLNIVNIFNEYNKNIFDITYVVISKQTEKLLKAKGCKCIFFKSTSFFRLQNIMLKSVLFNSLLKKFKIKNKFEDFILNLSKKEVKVIFYELPTNHLERYFNDDYLLSYNYFVNNLSKSFPLLKVNKLLFNDDNYRDIDHINNSGANLATKQIIYYLKTDTLGISSSFNSAISKPRK